jgi:hypothetical protein
MLATRITSVVCDTLLGIMCFKMAGCLTREVPISAGGSSLQRHSQSSHHGFGVFTVHHLQDHLAPARDGGGGFSAGGAGECFPADVDRACGRGLRTESGQLWHESSVFSLAPYIPSIGGMLFLGWWLREDKRGTKPDAPVVIGGTGQKA